MQVGAAYDACHTALVGPDSRLARWTSWAVMVSFVGLLGVFMIREQPGAVIVVLAFAAAAYAGQRWFAGPPFDPYADLCRERGWSRKFYDPELGYRWDWEPF